MTRLTRALSLALALLIAVTSQQMATARTAMKDARGEVILCTGSGPVTITIDAQGNPLNGTGAPAHICPDCALSLMALINAAPSPTPQTGLAQTLASTRTHSFQAPVPPANGHARDPPSA